MQMLTNVITSALYPLDLALNDAFQVKLGSVEIQNLQ